MRTMRMTMRFEGHPKDVSNVIDRAIRSDRVRSIQRNAEQSKQLLIPEQRRAMKLTQNVYLTAISQLSRLKNEQGAMLIGPASDEELVDEIIFDHWGKGTPVQFEFHAEKLNQILQKCMTQGRDCRGFCHNHPAGHNSLSNGDIEYVKKVFAMNEEVDSFYMPIFVDGEIAPFIVHSENPYKPEKVNLYLL